MKNNVIRFVTLVMAIIMCIGTILPTAAIEVEEELQYDLLLRAYYNLASTRRIVVDNEEMRLSNDSYIDIYVINVVDDYYEGYGEVNGDDAFSMVFSGQLTTKNVTAVSDGICAENVDTLVGVLTGRVIETDEVITLSIHTIPSTSYSYVFVSVGANQEFGTNKTFIFGTVFNEMIEMVGDTYHSEETIVDDSEIIAPTNDIMTAAVEDYDTLYQGTAYTRYQIGLTDEYLPMVAVSLYSPDRMFCNSDYSAFVKINASNNNMLVYLRARYYGVLTAAYSTGSCSIYAPSSSINDYLRFSDPLPDNESFSVTLNVPSWAFGSLSRVADIIPVTFNIFLYTIKAKLSNNSGSMYYNKIVWSHNYSRDLTWTDSSPAETTNGYSGGIIMTYMKNANVGKTFTISATGYVNFTFTGSDAGIPYTGSGSFEALPITKTIYIDSYAS